MPKVSQPVRRRAQMKPRLVGFQSLFFIMTSFSSSSPELVVRPQAGPGLSGLLWVVSKGSLGSRDAEFAAHSRIPPLWLSRGPDALLHTLPCLPDFMGLSCLGPQPVTHSQPSVQDHADPELDLAPGWLHSPERTPTGQGSLLLVLARTQPLPWHFYQPLPNHIHGQVHSRHVHA